MGSAVQNSTFSEHGFVAYQIKGMNTRLLGGVEGQIIFESSHVAYQNKEKEVLTNTEAKLFVLTHTPDLRVRLKGQILKLYRLVFLFCFY